MISIFVFLLALAVQVSAEDKMTIENFIISAGETKELSITLENEVAYAAFQFNLYLPEGLTVLEYSADKARMPEGTALSMSQVKDGSYKFIAAAMSRNPIVGTNGSIVTIKVTAGEDLAGGSLTGYFRKVKLSKLDGMGASYEEMAFPITVLAPSTVTVKSYERVYGDENPEFGFDVEGGELDGTPEITCEATETSPVGTYDIVISKGSVSNYNVTYIKGTLTIKKAPLTISAGNFTRKKGKENPEFILNYEGFKNGETEEVLTKKPTATTTATKTSPIGNYPVEISGAEAQNYEITHVDGVLVIELLPGDANSNGKVDIDDLNAIVNYIMGDTPDNFDEDAADLNGDKVVNAVDIVKLIDLLDKD